MDPQSFEGREREILSNPALEWTMQQFPGHTKGEVLFLMLPLAVRHKIYDYHALQYRSAAPSASDGERDKRPTRSRKTILPLTQTCRTFRMEMKGINASRIAVFKDERTLHNFIRMLRKQALTPYVILSALNEFKSPLILAPRFVSSITIDLAAPNSQIRSLDSLRSIINAASKELKFVQWLSFHVSMVKQRVGAPLKTLMTDGTMELFAQLGKVRVRDLGLEARFRAYDGQSKELIRAKIRKWTELLGIDEKLDSELLALAACMARLNSVNLALALIMGQWRRDSGVGLDEVKGSMAQMKVADDLGVGGSSS